MLRRTHAAPKKHKAESQYALEDLGHRVRSVPLAYRLAFADSHLRCREQTGSVTRSLPWHPTLLPTSVGTWRQ